MASKKKKTEHQPVEEPQEEIQEIGIEPGMEKLPHIHLTVYGYANPNG